MKVFYLNDRQTTATVVCKTAGKESWDYERTPLLPGEGKTFDVDVPEGRQLWVKVWETNVVRLDDMPVEEK